MLIMQIADQVNNLAQALVLGRLGISTAGSLYSYHLFYADGSDKPVINLKATDPEDSCNQYPALSVAELGLAIGNNTRYDINYSNVSKQTGRLPFIVWEIGVIYRADFKTEAEARAYALINLLTDKILTPEDVNERLKG